MRIIAGEYKGRRLNTPIGRHVRPTGDKVKEAVFSIIAPHIDGAVVADLFAGTGNMGLEALSRGAEKCYFADSSRDSFNLVKENIRYCKAEEKSSTILGTCDRALGTLKEKIDIFFLDPPYLDNLLLLTIEKIDRLELLAEDGIIVAEHPLEVKLPDTIGNFEKLKDKRYGKTVISVYC